MTGNDLSKNGKAGNWVVPLEADQAGFQGENVHIAAEDEFAGKEISGWKISIIFSIKQGTIGGFYGMKTCTKTNLRKTNLSKM